jgi:hypothetical protein
MIMNEIRRYRETESRIKRLKEIIKDGNYKVEGLSVGVSVGAVGEDYCNELDCQITDENHSEQILSHLVDGLEKSLEFKLQMMINTHRTLGEFLTGEIK